MNIKSILMRFSVLIALAISNFNTWAQPVVKVPPACQVVQVGTGVGTVLGFGGVVGNGGVVIMPDPFKVVSPAGDFTYVPNGTTQIGWGMQGDLSIYTSTTSGSAIQGAGASPTLTIQSYNENLRIPSESTLPSTPNLARSKGRISVSYSSPGCGGGAAISFDVYKTYANTGAGAQYVPPIVGPDCWLPNTPYTYSVDQIATDNLPDGIGLDKYYWTITDALGNPVPGISTAYYSADKSSYTFTTPTSFAGYNFPFTVQTCYGRANPWDGDAGVSAPHTTCVTHTVVSAPTAPTLSTPIPTCLNTGIHTFSTTYTPVAGQTYTWTSSNASWTLTQSPGNLSITTMDDNPGVLTLTITGPCQPATFTYNINRSLTAGVTTISGATCVSDGTSSNYILNSPDPVLNNGTCWTLPTGWTKTNLNGAASSVSILVPAGTAAGPYTVSAYSCLCPGGVISLTVNVKPTTPAGITGPTCVVRNGGPTASYTVPAVTGASSYTWSLPTGWSCSTACSSNSPVFQPGGTSTGPVNITVVANGSGGCNSAASLPLAVNYSPVTPSGIVVGCFSYGIAGTTTITVGSAPAPFYGTYTVTSVPTGLFSGTPSVDPLTGVITMNTLATASGTYVINITHVTSACGSSTTVSTPVTVAGNGATLALYPNPAVGGSDVYITTAPGSPTYTWTIAGVTVPGATTSALLLSSSTPPPGNVCVNVTLGGCTTVVCHTPGTHGLKQASGNTNDGNQAFAQQVKVYPNPTDGSFNITLPAFKTSAVMQMVDANGRNAGQYELKEGDNMIPDKGLAPGIYYLMIKADDNVLSYKIEILK